MNNIRKLTAVAGATMVAALIMTGCASSDGAPQTEGDDAGGREQVQLNVGYIDTSINGVGLIAVANDLDLWEKAGIDVNLQPFTNGPTQIQAMAAGSLDIGYIGGGATWMPASGQATIITPNEATYGDFVIASPDSGAESVEDLEGLRVGVPEGGSGEMILALALEEAGLTMDDVERVPLDPPNVVSSFVAGQIDVAAIFSPLSDQIFESVPDAVVLANNKDFPETEFVGAWVASNQAAADKPDAVSRFLEVWIEANDWRLDNVEEAVQLAADESGAPVEQLQGQADALEWWTSDTILENNESGKTNEQFDALVDLFVELGRIPEKVPSEEFVNLELFEQAKDARR
ncbi:aliphatic sulfonate ABC transporter substrate-binding protein [Agromyces sp. ZXT2-6]|uniref:aliphatic sulfonate ABC transporter substrate-binding protein n=1 Tax=Agromyces sp. ZXT2-6 TaxID=3461153 RepID=UPI0040550A7E